MKYLIYRLFQKLRSIELLSQEEALKRRFSIPKSVEIKYGKLNISGRIKFGENCKFLGDITIMANSPVEIGRYSVINGPNTDIYSSIHPVIIGSFCSIARNVSIQEFNHDVNNFTTAFIENRLMNRSNRPTVSKGAIIIGHDVWIGTQCIILSGARIGTGAIIAANSVVSGEIPPYAIVAGSPAKIIRFRFSTEKINNLLKSKWWEKINKENYDYYAELFDNNTDV